MLTVFPIILSFLSEDILRELSGDSYICANKPEPTNIMFLLQLWQVIDWIKLWHFLHEVGTGKKRLQTSASGAKRSCSLPMFMEKLSHTQKLRYCISWTLIVMIIKGLELMSFVHYCSQEAMWSCERWTVLQVR